MAGKMMEHLVVILGVIFLNVVIAQDYVTVNTPVGPLRGQMKKTQTGRAMFSFQGIPYAEPPVGDLRFQPPVPKATWSDVRDAIDIGSSCPQYRSGATMGNEDCLFLNVYGPDTPSQNADTKTVMVWIHGGCFTSGPGTSTKPDFFVDNDIVFVIINYRLGLLGFLSTGDELVPGNMGLKDQAEALRWVQRNIAAFGGDPDRVTIVGQSAGGASVHYHVLSPLSKGLFKNAISMSGAAINPWAFSKNATDRAVRFAQYLGYSATNTAELVEFLKTVDASALVVNIKNALSDEDKQSLFSCVWAPTIEPEHDSAFLTEESWVLVAEGRYNQVPYMAGVTDLEKLGDTQVGGKLSTEKQISDFNENFDEVIACDIRLPTKEEQLTAARAVKSFYYNGSDVTLLENYTTALRFLFQLESHFFFTEGVDKVVRSMAQHSSEPVYYYEFTYNGPVSQYPGAPGAAHGDDTRYMFSFKLDSGSDGALIRDQITAMWANFAKYDNPTPAPTSIITANWTPYILYGSPSYMRITAPLSLEIDLFAPYMTFWHSLLPQRKIQATRTA